MANQEHLEILQQGVKVWNLWRQQVFPPEKCTFEGRDPFQSAIPIVHYFYRTALFHTLESMPGVDLSGVDLSKVDLRGADLRKANLSGTNLSEADLSYAFLQEANLRDAKLNVAILNLADLRRARLSGADLSGASVGGTNFGDIDLRNVKGLDTVGHGGPSTVGIDTIIRSQAKIPEDFLRRSGVPEPFIIYMRSLVVTAFEFYTCFISYSTKNQEFADQLYKDLQHHGVRCWFAPEDLKIGAELRPTFDEAIRIRDKLLLTLSEQSIRSPWVKREVERALDEENRRQVEGRKDWTVLFPIRLDDSIFSLDSGWATDVKRRHIGDFTRWKDHDAYQKAFERLLRDLKADAKLANREQGG